MMKISSDSTVVNVGFWFLMGMLGMVLFFQVGPFVETSLWPVYSKFKLVEAVETEDGTIATFYYTKHRACEPRGTQWFVGEVGITQRMVGIRVQDDGTPRPPQPIGTHYTLPYLIDITKEELEHSLYAELFSRCPWIPWTTRTVIYP